MAEVKYIEEIANGIENLKKSLGKDVVEMCTLLKTVVEAIRERPGLPKELTDTITKHIQDIYQCLKLHLVFHGVEHETADLECNTSSKPRKPAKSDIPRLDPYKELEKLGPILHLKDEDLKNEILPDPTSVLDYCVDPWSTLIEIVSAVEISKESPRGSEAHAKGVMEKIQAWSKTTSSNSKFRPKVLAKVSHDSQWFVGSSMAVSQFLRPLCLHKRIANFQNGSLQKAIVFYQPLDIKQNQNWSFSAFKNSSASESTLKPFCQNCAWMFKNLKGSVVSNLGGENTFLAACAEYCPVNQLLKDDQDTLLSENERQRINAALEGNRKQCTLYYKRFQDIEKKCRDACKVKGESKNVRCAKVYCEIYDTVHIFGRKPECNASFGGIS